MRRTTGLLLVPVLALTGCTSSTQTSPRTGAGQVTGQATEQVTEERTRSLGRTGHHPVHTGAWEALTTVIADSQAYTEHHGTPDGYARTVTGKLPPHVTARLVELADTTALAREGDTCLRATLPGGEVVAEPCPETGPAGPHHT